MQKFRIKIIFTVISLTTILLPVFSQNNDKVLTDIDGNKYKIVKIGTQYWMGENLKTTRYNDGEKIQLVEKDKKWEKAKVGSYCWFKNDMSNSNKKNYGALYNWKVAISNKICPIGWHVPTIEEWEVLHKTVGGKDSANTKLKTTKGWKMDGKDGNGTNEFGFDALPAGHRRVNGYFSGESWSSIWWSTTPDKYRSDDAQDYRVDARDGEKNGLGTTLYFGGLSSGSRRSGKSIRCLKD